MEKMKLIIIDDIKRELTFIFFPIGCKNIVKMEFDMQNLKLLSTIQLSL